MQSAFEEQDFRASYLARKVESQAVEVALHLAGAIVEGRLSTGNEWDIRFYAVPVFVPRACGMSGSEERGESGSFCGRPCNHNSIVTFKSRKVVGFGRRRRQRDRRRNAACGPQGSRGKLSGWAGECSLQAGIAKALLRCRWIVVEPHVREA